MYYLAEIRQFPFPGMVIQLIGETVFLNSHRTLKWRLASTRVITETSMTHVAVSTVLVTDPLSGIDEYISVLIYANYV